MTKRSRNRRKGRRADKAKFIKLMKAALKVQRLLVKRTKEEILAIRNPAYECLIP